MCYEINLKEKALDNKLKNNKIMIPLLSKRDLQQKLPKIPEDTRNKIGWIHIGLDTLLDLEILDTKKLLRSQP